MSERSIQIRWLGRQEYQSSWEAMQRFTNARDPYCQDEIWLLEHEPVFTQGQNGKPEHILTTSTIPIVKSDRGGQVTYHGPGQLMMYTLIDLKRKRLNIRQFINALELSIIHLLETYHIHAYGKSSAPGVYVRLGQGEGKICSIGLRVRRGCTFHGLAFNIAMDLAPFQQINPCGFANLQMTQLSALTDQSHSAEEVGRSLVKHLLALLDYDHHTWIS